MRQKKGEGTKIAQAAKELGVTSVTIRRYLTEFDIETTADENGIKVLPAQAMEELCEIRKLKEEGLTNPKVLEILEEMRLKGADKSKSKEKDKEKDKEKEKEKAEPAARRVARKTQETAPAAKRKVTRKAAVEEEEETEEPETAEEDDEDVEEARPSSKKAEADDEEDSEDDGSDSSPAALAGGEGKSKYSLTCQTCNKTFEHMNPRLRDCLDCYRIKRKERRRGGDKHKNVIQNPLAQQVISKNQQIAQQAESEVSGANAAVPASSPPSMRVQEAAPKRISVREQLNFAPVGTTPSVYQQKPQIRSYRKAIEETRQITSNLKRRLERPDLPESERRFLEQIYAYQLILHQGWKHLSEYRQGDSSHSSSRSSD